MRSTTEEWRPVPGFPDYFVSDLGRVLSTHRGKRHLMKPYPLPVGYVQVVLTTGIADGQRRKIYRIHQLVMLAFVGPCPTRMEIRHLNGAPADNRLANLAYGTHSENIRDVVDHGNHHHSRRTECAQGHPYDAVNTLWSVVHKTGRYRRNCRMCSNGRRRALTAAKRIAA